MPPSDSRAMVPADDIDDGERVVRRARLASRNAASVSAPSRRIATARAARCFFQSGNCGNKIPCANSRLRPGSAPANSSIRYSPSERTAQPPARAAGGDDNARSTERNSAAVMFQAAEFRRRCLQNPGVRAGRFAPSAAAHVNFLEHEMRVPAALRIFLGKFQVADLDVRRVGARDWRRQSGRA